MRMISERLCDTEVWSNAENSDFIFLYIKIENRYLKW